VIGYATLGTDAIDKALAFYDALLGEVGAKRLMEMGPEDGHFTLYGTD
jgi:catechol 2,3-dioxygenase-like lactoylglutathione lyase family enzyme